MFLSRFFSREQRAEGQSEVKPGAVEHLAPARYFTPERAAGIRTALDNLGTMRVTDVSIE